MWFDQEERESCGYTDMVGDLVFAAIVVVIVSMVAMGIWVLRNGGVL